MSFTLLSLFLKLRVFTAAKGNKDKHLKPVAYSAGSYALVFKLRRSIIAVGTDGAVF